MLAIVAGVRTAWPVHEIQVHIVGVHVLEGGANALANALVPRIVEFGRQPDLVAGNSRGLDAEPDFLFICIAESSVNVAIPTGEGGLNRGLDLGRGGLPGAETDGRDFVSSIESKRLARVLSVLQYETSAPIHDIRCVCCCHY